jgi:hypothetical protein
MRCDLRLCAAVTAILCSAPCNIQCATKPTKVQADYFVSPAGNDAWSGTMASPNARRTDGPFATPGRAIQAVRSRSGRDGASTITVMLRGGRYDLPEPLALLPDDSGTTHARVVYSSYPGEKAVLSGGRRIDNWQVLPNGYWQTTLPEVRDGTWYFEQLFVNGQRRYRSRLPKGGACYYIAGEAPATTPSLERGFDRFRFKPGQLRADWANLGDIEVLSFHIWTMSRMRIAAIDEESSLLTLTGPTRCTAYYCKLGAGQRFMLENVREALTEPGEWYLDRSGGVLTYIPMEGETPGHSEVIAPRLAQIMRLQGDTQSSRFVEHLEFHDLEFSYTNWVNGPGGLHSIQAEADLGAAISARAARDVVLEGCRVTHTGEWAIEWGNGCVGNTVAGCTLADLGAGGIKIGEIGGVGPGGVYASDNTVSDNLIVHGGRMHPAGIGVWVSHSPRNRIIHNTIDDFYYTGVSLGWSWGYGPSQTHDNLVAHNRITRIGQGVLSDMGGIYTLGLSEGTVLDHNWIENVRSFDYGGWGIYFDEGTSGIVARNNIVSHTRSAGFHQHYGRNNLVENNIFAFGEKEQVARTRAEDHLSFSFLRNTVLFNNGKLLGGNWNGDNYRFDSNLYCDQRKKTVKFNGTSLTLWQKRGQDVHSIVADPRFVDAAGGDFRLRNDSPARRLGLVPIPVSGFGCSPREVGIPPVAPAFRAAAPSPPMPLREDFESVPPGSRTPDAVTSEESGKSSARITSETASKGHQCLKFSDAPGQNVAWTPNIHYTPHYSDGLLRATFALRVESGAVFYHEWRDDASPYHVGPSLHIGPDGTLTANGKRLTQLPAGQWVQFEIVCGTGSRSSGSYRLRVQLPGKARSAATTFACDRRFRKLDWFGFVSDTTKESTVYLDDLRLERRSR